MMGMNTSLPRQAQGLKERLDRPRRTTTKPSGLALACSPCTWKKRKRLTEIRHMSGRHADWGTVVWSICGSDGRFSSSVIHAQIPCQALSFLFRQDFEDGHGWRSKWTVTHMKSSLAPTNAIKCLLFVSCPLFFWGEKNQLSVRGCLRIY